MEYSIKTLDLKEILQKHKNMYGFETWEETLEYLLIEDGPIIKDLRNELRRENHFREPIVLGDGYVLDGTHRLIAHTLENVSSVLTTSSDFVQKSLKREYLSTSIKFKEFVSSDEIDSYIDELRSLKITDHLWISAASCSGWKNVLTVEWEELIRGSIIPFSSEINIFLSTLLKDVALDIKTFISVHEDFK